MDQANTGGFLHFQLTSVEEVKISISTRRSDLSEKCMRAFKSSLRTALEDGSGFKRWVGGEKKGRSRRCPTRSNGRLFGESGYGSLNCFIKSPGARWLVRGAVSGSPLESSALLCCALLCFPKILNDGYGLSNAIPCGAKIIKTKTHK
nr:hypothetical protein CFP56_39418 [Quercus suber]